MKLAFVLSLILLYAGLSAMPHAQEASQLNSDVVQRFGEAAKTLPDAVGALATAVQVDDRASVAALFRYPLRVALDGACERIRGEAELLDCYDQVVTPEVADIITSQQLNTLGIDERGVVYMDGAVHLRPRCLDRNCGRSFWLIDEIYPTGSKPVAEDTAGSS